MINIGPHPKLSKLLFFTAERHDLVSVSHAESLLFSFYSCTNLFGLLWIKPFWIHLKMQCYEKIKTLKNRLYLNSMIWNNKIKDRVFFVQICKILNKGKDFHCLHRSVFLLREKCGFRILFEQMIRNWIFFKSFTHSL